MTQVLYSTTRQWNPGDEIILRGVRHLIEKIAPGHNPVIWNRNPSIRPGNTSLDNSFDNLRHSLQSMDYVVFAGSPEWTGCRNVPLFHDLLKNDTRCSFIGIGSAFAGQPLDQATVSVMQTKTDCIISRDQTTSDNLQGWGIPCRVLPCPSIFSNAKRKPRTGTGKIGLNFQGTRTPWQRIDPVTGKRCFDIFQMLMSEFDCTVICNYIDELDEATSLFPRDRIRYSYDSSEYLDFFQEVDVVIGTRLHSCLGAIACGTPAILLGTENDLRLRGASEIVPVLATANVLSWSSVLQAVRNLDVELESRKIIDWIDTSERLYQPFLDRMATSISPRELSTARSSSPATIYADIQQKIAASKPLSPDIKAFVLHFPVTIRLPELCLAVSGVLLEKFRPKFSFRAQYRRLRDGSISNYLRYKLGLTNKVRWADLGRSYADKWDSRTRTLAQWIRPSAVVADLGAGRMHLKEFLPENCTYIPIDLHKNSPETLVCDFNKANIPVDNVDFAVASGFIEYIFDVRKLADSLARAAKYVACSYNVAEKRTSRNDWRFGGWVNNFSTGELVGIFKDAGFELVDQKEWLTTDSLFLFKRR